MALFHIQACDNLPQAMQPCTILPNKGIVSGVWYMGIREWPHVQKLKFHLVITVKW